MPSGRGCCSRAGPSSRAPRATPAWASPSRPSSRATRASSRRPTSNRRKRSTRSRRLGRKSIVCPTNVDPEDPRSYYSVSSRLEREIPNSWKANQYDNLSNTAAHYEQTGPEIWEQTDGRVTHLVVGVGTGGTASGVARALKERNPKIKVWGIDTYGSVFKKYKETGIFDKHEIYPYITEGIGEDFLPKNVDFSRHRSLREGDRQGRGDHDAAYRARRGHLRGQFRRRGDGRPAAAARSLDERRCRRRDLSRPRVALSGQDVQRRLDAFEGIPGEERHDGAGSCRGRAFGRTVRHRSERAGRARAADHERA